MGFYCDIISIRPSFPPTKESIFEITCACMKMDILEIRKSKTRIFEK